MPVIWSYTIDGFELNDGATFITVIPEIDDGLPTNPILVDLQNDYPFYVRSQPLNRVMNINVQILPCDWSTYSSRMTTLKGLFTPGSHTLAVRTHGMTATKSLTVFPVNFIVGDPKIRRVSIQVTAPEAVWI
jgi:hypothetical protein